MDTERARSVFTQYGPAVAYVEIESADGVVGIGSAFHVGEGVFVTARHVVDGLRIRAVRTTERAHIRLEGDAAANAREFLAVGEESVPIHTVSTSDYEIVAGPVFHPDERVDVAVFKVKTLDPLTPYVPLGSHLDDWLGQSDFVLSEALVLGYPPIPTSVHPVLIGAKAVVHAMIDRYNTPHPHFVLSGTPRGGFSGGVAFSEWGFVLGVVTESALWADQSPELGWLNVLTVEPIYTTLATHKLLPDVQAEMWDDFWNTTSVGFTTPVIHDGGLDRFEHMVAHLELFDDGRRFHVTVSSSDEAILAAALEEASEHMDTASRETIRDGMVRLHASSELDKAEASTLVERGARAAAEVFLAAGLKARPEYGDGPAFWEPGS